MAELSALYARLAHPCYIDKGVCQPLPFSIGHHSTRLCLRRGVALVTLFGSVLVLEKCLICLCFISYSQVLYRDQQHHRPPPRPHRWVASKPVSGKISGNVMPAWQVYRSQRLCHVAWVCVCQGRCWIRLGLRVDFMMCSDRGSPYLFFTCSSSLVM